MRLREIPVDLSFVLASPPSFVTSSFSVTCYIEIYMYRRAGDNIDGSATDAMKSMDQAFSPVIAAKIPWAAVLGNHDQESNLPRAKVMEYLTKMEHSMSEMLNPSMESLLGKSVDRRAPIEVHGFGNYYLQVFGGLDSDSSNSSLLNLYLFDSGDYSKFNTVGGYDWVRASQLLWFETLAAKLKVITSYFSMLLETVAVGRWLSPFEKTFTVYTM